MKTITLIPFMLSMMSVYAQIQPLQTVDHVDLEKYLGRWFEIASYPVRFQQGCRCTTADYDTVPGKNYIRVINRCVKYKNGRSRITVASAKAFVMEGSGNARLKVQFFWPLRGDYYIIGLADDYSWAVVGHPKRKYLWVLNRESYMTSDSYSQALKVIREKGYDPGRLVKTSHNCDNF